MNLSISVTQEELSEVLLNVAPVRPVYIWGAPGIGKSAIVEQFASDVGLPCVSLLGSQLAPEDIIGIPQVKDGTSEFLPPKMIARKEPYVLFLDELNACTQEVQKAFYSLIYEKRVGEYHLPEDVLRMLVFGCVSASHAGMFLAFTKQLGNGHLLNDIIKGVKKWPARPEERDVLYFVAQSFRAKLLHELPESKQKMNQQAQYLAHRAKALLKELALINYEIAQMVVSAEEEKTLPDWFMVEIVRDLPRLVKAAS